MYITAENYEEMYLKGKDENAVVEEVGKIRREIERIKKKIESPAYVKDALAVPSEAEQVDIFRGYFGRAVKYLAQLKGVSSVLTEEEKAADIVNSMTDDVTCLTLTVGRYLQDKYELKLDSNGAEIHKNRLGGQNSRRSVSKDAAREMIRSLHVGEWKEIYTPEQYGCTLNEPTRWEVRIDYVGKTPPRFYDGIGIFPYNFDVLANFLGADIID